MTPEETKKYLALAATQLSYDVDARGSDVVPVPLMRRILKKLILRGTCVRCELCGKTIDNERDLTLDHIVPRSRGGSDWLHNMQPAHKHCNELKGNTVTSDDIKASNDSPLEILQRKKNRKESKQKNRKIVHIKPWQIGDFCDER